MASSRLEKIGTIFDRVTGLLKSNAMKTEDKPVWYEIYKAFPPKIEPKFNRPVLDINVRDIFYEEDIIRAQFHKNSKRLPPINLSNSETQTKTQRFIQVYNDLKNDEMVPKNELFSKALEVMNSQTSKLIANENEEPLKKESETVLEKPDIKKIFDEK